MRDAVGESSTAPQLMEVVAGPQQLEAIKTQDVVAQESKALSELEVGKVSEESKDMEDYPFRQEIEDLVKSP